MNNIKNNKGFTLVELLAVIVILALIMVFAVPSVLNTMNSSRKKVFAMYGEKVMSAAEEYVQQQVLLGTSTSELAGSDGNGKCYSLSTLGLTNTGSYSGSTRVSLQNGEFYYEVFLTDSGNYAFKGVTRENLTTGGIDSGNYEIGKATTCAE